METENYPLRAIKDIGGLSPDGVLVYDLSETRVEYFNKSLLTILGIKKARINDIETLRQTILDDNKVIEAQLQALKANSRITDVELRIQGKDPRYISCDAYFIGEGSLVVAIVKDITKSKQHSDYIVDFGARKDVILDMTTHNLSGPLNMTNNLLDLVDRTTQTQQIKQLDRPIRMIRENTQQCIEIINSFLKHEHLVSKDIHVNSTRFDVLVNLQHLVSKFKDLVHDREIDLSAKSKSIFITGDDVKLFQVFHNLVSNAAKFTHPNGKITIEVVERKDSIQILVSDDGIGIPEYLYPHLFKLNTPAARDGLRGEKSIGMGLYIVKKLTDLMQGTVTFKSEENKGTTFTVQLPKNLEVRLDEGKTNK